MKIYIGADHAGFELKKHLSDFLHASGHEVIDQGSMAPDPNDDFPQFAARTVTALLADGDENSRGILICGSGQGMAMAANRFKGIRASLVWDVYEARSSRNDDDSNVLCLPARDIRGDKAIELTTTWLNTPFAGAPRFIRRIKEMDELASH